MNIRTASVSSAGGRQINDDSVSIIKNENGVYSYVGDGLGGYAGGKKASTAAAESLSDSVRRGSLLTDGSLLCAAEKANNAVINVQKTEHGNMKTTLVFLAVEDGRAKWMHIGDSRLYHFKKNILTSQTMDHSVSQVAVLMGEITKDEIRRHEDRNRVLRALGGDNAKPDISPTVILTADEDVFLLCTDGFWEYVYESEMEETLGRAESPEMWLSEMENLIRSRAPENNDNYTAAAVFA